MSASLAIATAQSVILPDVAANRRHIQALMAQARAEQARLIHFPECALSGYVKHEIHDWSTVDWDAVAAALAAIAADARRLGIWVVLGCAHPLAPPHRPYNSVYVISDQGAMIGRYDKRFCSHTEITDWFSPGFAPFVFELDGFRFGCCVCIEIQFPEIFAEYERLGVDCVLLSTYADDPEWRIKARAHAGFNCYWLSLSVPASCSVGLPACLIGPNGAVIAEAAPTGRAAAVVGYLDRGAAAFDIALNHARPWRREARRGLIYASRRIGDPGNDEPPSR